jgi:hypothetical protein
VLSSTNSDLKFKIRKWTDIGKLSIRPRTVRPWTEDRPSYQELDSPVRNADSLNSSGRGPSAAPARTVRRPCADRPRQAVKVGQRQQTCYFHYLQLLSRSPLTKKVSFVDCARTEKGSYARTVRQLVKSSTNMSSSRGLGGLRKKLAGRFKSKRPRADDADYTPTTDSEAQSSAGGTESMDTEDIPHIHPDYPIDITGWIFPKRRFSMAEYCSRRTMNQYSLPSDTNVQFFHTQLQFDVFWGTLMDTNFHKHQVIDWSFMLGQSVMADLIPKFETCGLYQFMGQRTDFSEMAVKQFLATAEIDIEEESITWMTGFKRYSATFADFAAANSLNYGIISARIDLYTEDNFEDFV